MAVIDPKTPRAMGKIMAVAAVFEIHIERTAEIAPSVNKIRWGLLETVG